MKWVVSTPQKLVAFLQAKLDGNYSGKFLRRLLEANLCRVNGKVERFGSKTVQKGDRVELAPGWKEPLLEKPAPLQTLYETSSFKIVDKPVGWVCHDKQVPPGHFLVHRLDKDTTGLLILAKETEARDELIDLFQQRKIEKTYLALVDGIPPSSEGVRKSFLGKKGSYQGQTIWGSCPKGLSAITHWKVLAVGEKASLLQCEPLTGRTHQIRVHMAEMGHPILVDRQYAASFRSPLFAKRPLLHAYRLRFSWRGKLVDVTAPLGADFRAALRGVGIDVRHLRQFLGEEEHQDSRDESHQDKQAEEVQQASHFVHQASEKPSVKKRNPDTDVPKSYRKGSKTGRRQATHHRKADRRK